MTPCPSPPTRMVDAASSVIDDLEQKYAQKSILNLCPGATHFGIPASVRARISQYFMEDEKKDSISKYGPVLGSLQLRRTWAKAISEGAKKHATSLNNDAVFADSELPDLNELWPNHELMITAGANQAFVNVLLALCDRGDDVLLILPYYFSHYNSLVMAEVNAVLIPVDEEFEPDIQQIERMVTSQAKALVVVNPGNPSGKVFSCEQMDMFADLCQKQGLWLIVDEAYREFVFSDNAEVACSSLQSDNTIQLYTASKAYGLAGWRIGAVRYPRRLSNVMKKVQDNIVTHASHFCQQVALEVIKYDPFPSLHRKDSQIGQMLEVRKILLASLQTVYNESSLQDEFVIPLGAFYFFLPYEKKSQRSKLLDSDDMNVVDRLAVDHNVLVAPGFIFGMHGYIRVSYGCIPLADAIDAAAILAGGIRHVLSCDGCKACRQKYVS